MNAIKGMELRARTATGEEVEQFRVKFLGDLAFGVRREGSTDKEFLELFVGNTCVDQSGEFVRFLRNAYKAVSSETIRYARNCGKTALADCINSIPEACDIIARLEGEAKDTRLELACPETMDTEKEELCKVAAIVVCEKHRLTTALAAKEKENKQLRSLKCPPISDGETCACILAEQEAEIERLKNSCILPKECPEGGEHHWVSHCKKCDMQIYYNPEATIGSKAPVEDDND
jgi:hypothetical protein